MRLKKNNVYIVRLVEKSREILADLHIVRDDFSFIRNISQELIEKKCCKRSYLRGAFLAGGSVNNPETSSYHLEIFSLYKEHNDAICELMNGFDLNSKTLERRKGYITYLKEAEKITEFLNIIGAHNALLRFEDIRIVRDMRNSVNRLVNCETANLNKTIGAALRQIENIRYIDETVGLDILPDKLREIAQLRRDYQDVTLKELGEMVSGGKLVNRVLIIVCVKSMILQRNYARETVAKNKRLKGNGAVVQKRVQVSLKTVYKHVRLRCLYKRQIAFMRISSSRKMERQ